MTLRNHLSKYENIDPEFVSIVIKALYVDDFASGKNNVLGCFELCQKLKTRFSEGGFNMRNWASNSSELNELIKKEETTLLSGKPAVEPTKSVETETIPRLKLMACLTLALLITAVYKALASTIEVDTVINWNDSQIVWWWINGESKQFKQFVQNRVENIRSLWSKEHWRYCPSELNPSDIASRGSKASDLVSSDLWWKGAPFLEKEERQWPNVPNCPITGEKVTSEAEKELKVGDATKTSSFMTASSKVSQSVSEVIQPETFSSFSRLIRVTALVLKFIHKVKRSMETQLDLNMQERIAAEHLWYKEMQMKLDEKEKSSTVFEQLGVFKDADGVLRCKGRIQNCSLPYSAKFQSCYQGNSTSHNLVIRQSHEDVKHNGVKETLTEVRSKFWTIKGTQAVKDVPLKCVIS